MKLLALTASAAQAVSIQWYDYTEANVNGSSWYAAVNFCEAKGGQLCTYEQYCPGGYMQPPADEIPDYNSTMTSVWAPVASPFNGLVNIGFSNGQYFRKRRSHGDGGFTGITCVRGGGTRYQLSDLSNFNNGGVCCAFGESENQVAQFCDWEGETCKGETVNDYQHMLVMKNVNEYGSFNIKFDSYPVRIGFGNGDDVSQAGILYEFGIEDCECSRGTYMTLRKGPVGSRYWINQEGFSMMYIDKSFLDDMKSPGITLKIIDGAIWVNDLPTFSWDPDGVMFTANDPDIDPEKLTHMYVSQPHREWQYYDVHTVNLEITPNVDDVTDEITTWPDTTTEPITEPTPPPPTNPPKPVTHRLQKLKEKFHVVLAEFPATEAQKTKFGNKYDSLLDKVLTVHEKQKVNCDYPSTWKEHLDVDRMVTGNPCFALRQLSKGVQRWTDVFTYNCKRDDDSFAERMWNSVKRLRDRISKKYDCPEE